MSKLDIKSEMRAIDTKDRAWYKSLTKEEREKYDKQMWVQMRWASSVKGSNAAHYLMLVNEFTNVHFNLLKHHPRLQHQLLQLAGTGKTQFHEWIAPGKRGKKNRLLEWLAKEYPQYSDDELELLIQENDPALWKDRMETQGMSKKEIKDMFK